jgi:hypothetical protein
MKMKTIQLPKAKAMLNTEEINEILNKGMGVQDALSFGKKVSQDKPAFKTVLDIALTANDKTADKAAWVIYKAVLECDCKFAIDFREDLIEGLCNRTLSPAVLRELLKVLLQLHPETHPSFGRLFDRSQEWMFDPAAPAAIRYASLNVIELAGKKHPDLIPECWEIIQTAKELATGPWQRRCKRVQQGLDRCYKKHISK